MTDEEKAAAAKAAAEAAKKAAESKSTEPEDDETEKPEDEPKTYDAAYVKKLKDENAKRRVQAKELTEKQSRLEKALAVLQGKDAPELEPIERAKQQSDSRMRNAFLKAELASVARDAHDPATLFQVRGELFKSVTVDLETEQVDAEELSEAVEKLRKSKPFLFKASTTDETKPKNGSPLPKDRGTPKDGNTELVTWQTLKKAGRVKEAQEYYQKNGEIIRRQL